MTTTPSLFDAPPDIPVRPYAGTSGWSGSDTSRARAEHADTTGITGRRQQQILVLLDDARGRGMTWREIGEQIDGHHGSISSALSTLHKAGAIARLAIARDGCAIYVGLDHVGERTTVPPARTAAHRVLLSTLDNVEQALLAGDIGHAIAIIRATRNEWQ